MCHCETEQRLPRPRSDERGVAFLLSLVALTVLGLVATGGFYMVRQEFRAAQAGEHAAVTLGVSETGVADILSNWQGEHYSMIPIGGVEQVTSLGKAGSAIVDVRRMSERLYLLDSQASLYATPTNRRRVAVLTRLVSTAFHTGAAAVSLNSATIDGSAALTGVDFTPLTWGGVCPGAGGTTPGLQMIEDSLVSVVSPATLDGAPPILEVPGLTSTALHDFGGVSRAELIAIADVRLLGGPLGPTSPQTDVNGNCLRSAPMNWGDPYEPASSCGRYFPVIHVTGNAELTSGTVGQGILIVDGDLKVQGDVEFYGAIAVLGHLEVDGAATLLAGHIRATDLTLRNASMVRDSWIAASSCAVDRAILNNPFLTRPEALPERSWVDVTALGG